MNAQPELTPSSEDYLETIYELSLKQEDVRSVDIAEQLRVSKASVNKAIGILREAGLIRHAHYGLVHLTETGQKRASEILRIHQMLKRFLVEVLDIDEVTAEKDACRMEHVISRKTKENWHFWLQKNFNS